MDLRQAVAVEYRDDGVRCNAVLPSVIDTPANRATEPDADHSRWVQPAEIARVIVFLCSEESAPVSGAGDSGLRPGVAAPGQRLAHRGGVRQQRLVPDRMALVGDRRAGNAARRAGLAPQLGLALASSSERDQ